MKIGPTILRERLGEGQCIKLNVRRAMREALQNGSGDVSGPATILSKAIVEQGYTHPASPSSKTLSQRLMITSQFSLVWFSSVALAG